MVRPVRRTVAAGRRASASSPADVIARRALPGIEPRFHPVAAAVRKPPDQDSWLGLVKPPALGLFSLVMPSAQAGEVAFAGPPVLVVRDRVILVAARCRIAAAGEPTGALADVDHVPQRRGRLASFVEARLSVDGKLVGVGSFSFHG